jgi:uncharacterized protein YrrD
MQKTADVIGRAIVSETGEKMGTVSDVLVDPARGRAAGLVVQTGLLHGESVLPYDQVRVMGPDVVLARADGALVGADEWKRRGPAAQRVSRLRHRRVITSTGREVGTLGDVFLEDGGSIAGYDVERPRLGGMMRHHSRLPHGSDVAVGEDAVVVPEAVAEAFETEGKTPT